jgi:hypothetical protein
MLIAGLIVVELAIIGEAVVAVRGGEAATPYAQQGDARTASGSRLIEGGPHKVFAAGAQPRLTIDIGYADLTILTSKAPQIDVSLSASPVSGLFQATAPITATEDGETIRIATTRAHGWSTGDDRMVTVLVPPETQVTVVNGGDIKVDGLRAQASIHSVGNGSVSVEDYDAPALHVVTSDGPIILHQIVAARIDVASRNDTVEGTALQVRDGTVESDGRVMLGFATGADTLVSAQASDGKISLSGFADAQSLSSGGKSSEDGGLSSRTVRVGAGSGHLDVHSSDGDIDLAQEG